MQGHGAGWGDVDGDGWPDLYLATFHYKGTLSNRLLSGQKPFIEEEWDYKRHWWPRDWLAWLCTAGYERLLYAMRGMQCTVRKGLCHCRLQSGKNIT